MRCLLLFFAAFAAPFPSLPQQTVAPLEPPHLNAPEPGAHLITGKAPDSRWPVRVTIFNRDGAIVERRDVLVSTSDSSVVAGFTVSLVAGEIVQASFLMSGTEVTPSAPLVVSGIVAKASSRVPPAAIPVQVRGELAAGLTSIIVDATPTPTNSGYEVRLQACPGAVAAGIRDSTGFRPYAVTDASGQAVIAFEQPLAVGQSVSLCQKIVNTNDPSQPPFIAPGSGTTAITSTLDLGRVRYYFTSGVLLSNNQGFQLNSSGTQAGLFLALTADRSWLAPGPSGYRRLNLNTYLDARLTSVATQATGGTSAANLQSFTESQKAASFEAGIYIPWIVGEPWVSGKSRYSMFAAPLAKTGFVTLAGDGTNAAAAVPVTGSFYKSYSFGARLGIFQHFLSDSAAPELVSYVDFATGRFGDFEAFRDLTVEANPAASATGSHNFLLARPWRYSLEGILKVPHSPFIVGFNANLGSGAWPASRTAPGVYPFTQPRDDLRFLFGAQFDFSKLLSTVPQL